MGNRSSRYVEKHDHNNQLRTMQTMLKDLQQDCKEFQEETMQRNKRIKNDLKSIVEFNETQKKWFTSTDQEMKFLKIECERIKDLDELKTTLKKTRNEHIEDRTKITNKIREFVTKERSAWDDDVAELRERYDIMKRYSMELVSMDLAHEREIKQLQLRTDAVEKYKDDANRVKRGGASQNSSHFSPNEDALKEKDIFLREDSQSGSYELKFSKINRAIKRLQDDLQYAEKRKTPSADF